MRSATLFSGGEGAGLGMVAAGWEHAWGVEYDPKIAQVARDNGFNVLTADILQCDPANFEPVGWLHASPPCPNFSNAKTNAEETDNDRALAAKVCEFITELLPDYFTLENVYQYRKSKSWQRIARTLLTHGFQVNYWHVNMADYGVPQTRKRMIAVARRDGQRPSLPPATHSREPQATLFGARRQWVGWYEAIEDIYKQKRPYAITERLKNHLGKSNKNFPELFIFDGQNTSFDSQPLTIKAANEPIFTLNANRSLGEYLIKNGQFYASPTNFLIRWQTFPDNYQGANKRIIGNAVPPLFMQRLGEWLK